ncbi:DUF3298 and DUF4163 domain-containing protein [Halobacillus naozhouensis]|uniref:DUF3298 domain-containing protein n=1 Tax=Halobacillus naozhouensis TaxID=554880 RepID=A0ABY8J2U7_9BACI|nr:DUF3298 and DUF4163 domain-containing protein [Halobacillus naozhouensis]WFT75904.1 DUF3298 domain-containing protein [Halobacillus naozhouensis]
MKKISIIWFLLIITFSAHVFATESLYTIENRDKVMQDYEIHIDYPVFNSLHNMELQEKVNKKISNHLEDTMREVKRVAEESSGFPILYYGEEFVVGEDQFYSVVLTANISRGKKYNSSVTSINFENEEDGQIFTLKDIVDMNLLNQEVKKELASEPDTYYHQSFNSVREDTAFYISDEKLTLVFNKYEVAPGVYGTPEISIPLKKVKKDPPADETNVPFPQII